MDKDHVVKVLEAEAVDVVLLAVFAANPTPVLDVGGPIREERLVPGSDSLIFDVVVETLDTAPASVTKESVSPQESSACWCSATARTMVVVGIGQVALHPTFELFGGFTVIIKDGMSRKTVSAL